MSKTMIEEIDEADLLQEKNLLCLWLTNTCMMIIYWMYYMKTAFVINGIDDCILYVEQGAIAVKKQTNIQTQLGGVMLV